jgi:hypothetical protein
MLEELERDGSLAQDHALSHISSHFGDSFVYLNVSGNLVISRSVLRRFRKLSEDTVVWSRSQRTWYWREPNYPPGRVQV